MEKAPTIRSMTWTVKGWGMMLDCYLNTLVHELFPGNERRIGGVDVLELLRQHLQILLRWPPRFGGIRDRSRFGVFFSLIAEHVDVGMFRVGMRRGTGHNVAQSDVALVRGVMRHSTCRRITPIGQIFSFSITFSTSKWNTKHKEYQMGRENTWNWMKNEKYIDRQKMIPLPPQPTTKTYSTRWKIPKSRVVVFPAAIIAALRRKSKKNWDSAASEHHQ